MNGVIFNTLTVLLGSAVGLLLKKNIPRRLSEAVMIAIGLCTLYIGVDGALEGSNTIVLIVSLVCGTAVGTALDIDGRLNRLGLLVGDRLKRGGEESGVAEGFVTGSLLFCIGAMTIVGCINAGLTGDNKLLYACRNAGRGRYVRRGFCAAVSGAAGALRRPAAGTFDRYRTGCGNHLRRQRDDHWTRPEHTRHHKAQGRGYAARHRTGAADLSGCTVPAGLTAADTARKTRAARDLVNAALPRKGTPVYESGRSKK